MAKRILWVAWFALQPLPQLGNWGPVVAAIVLIAGGSGATAASIGLGGADRVSGSLWGILSVCFVLLILLFIATYRLQKRVDDHAASTPKLEFGQPQPSPEVISTRGSSAPIAQVSAYTAAVEKQIPCLLWRTSLSNVVDGTKACNVNVELASSDPLLPVLPVKLHEKHNDVAPYRQLRDIRSGEPVIFDVVAIAQGPDILFFWRSDLPEGSGYVYALSAPDRKIIDGKLKTTGMMITLRAIADPPVKIEEQDYRLVIDGRGWMLMELLKKQ
jgi:hypothetical protein